MPLPPPRPPNAPPPSGARPPLPPLPPRDDAGQRRVCGTCDLCCRLLTIDWPEYPELHKPADVPCKHLISGVGCRIHADRPMHCASFQCLWLMGFGPDELRPDRIGGFFDAVDAGQLLLVTGRGLPDPRSFPAVERFIDAWCAARKAKLVVYRSGREVREPGPGGPRRPR